jgi:hypothetical protein
MTFPELQSARTLLSLPERVTMQQLKARHRQLVKRHHPDSGSGDEEQIRAINAAYRLIMEYLGSYRFSFSEAEFYEQNPEEHLRRQFAYDPVWGAREES